MIGHGWVQTPCKKQGGYAGEEEEQTFSRGVVWKVKGPQVSMAKYKRTVNTEEVIEDAGEMENLVMKKKGKKQKKSDRNMWTETEVINQETQEEHSHSGKKGKKKNSEAGGLVALGKQNEVNNLEDTTTPQKNKEKRHKEDYKTDDAAGAKMEANINDGDSTMTSKKNKKKRHKDCETADAFGAEKEANINDGDSTMTSKKNKKKHHKDCKTGDALGTKEEANINDGDSTATPKKNKKMCHIKNCEMGDVAGAEEDEDNTTTPKMNKKRTKKEKVDDAIEEPQVSTKPASGLEYLRKWNSDRSNWKFQKMRQVWLLQHLYDSNLIPDADFSLMLEYVDSIKGMSRELTLKKAQNMMHMHEEAEGANKSEDDPNEEQKDKNSEELADEAKE